MKMPNFLIIGAAKSGTTSLHHYLNQHPQIYMSSMKEPNFFAFEGEELNFIGPRLRHIKKSICTSIEKYQLQFQGVTNESAIGDASWRYLYYPKAALRIKKHIPDAKLIAMLRNPVERAYSHFLMLVTHTREPRNDFIDALNRESIRIEKKWEADWHYTHLGFYYSQLKRYFETFNKDQIRIYLYDDFKDDNLAILQDIFKFLCVSDTFIPDMSQRHRETVLIPKNRIISQLGTIYNKINPAVEQIFPKKILVPVKEKLKEYGYKKPLLLPETYNKLISVFKDDILHLQDLINRDLSRWLL